MTDVLITYSIADFNRFIFEGEYMLNDETKSIIQFLEQNIVVSPVSESFTESSNSSFHKRPDRSASTNSFENRPIKRNGSLNGARKSKESTDWETIRSFKATKVETKTGTDKHIDNVRILLNKISSKNYDTQKSFLMDQIISIIELVEEDVEKKESDIKKVATIIFDIASTNKFYSELYAELYSDLVNRFSVFKDVLDGFVEKYIDSLNSIFYIYPNVDYDGFCAYTKTNDLRKATASFIINLMKNGILEKSVVLNIIMHLERILLQYIDESDRTNEVDETTENLYLFITQSKSFLQKESEWTSNIVLKIADISKMKSKDHPSLSSRAVFKYMDIMDNLSKP
jgi:hypothetical protein